MKKLQGWDAYVADAKTGDEDRSIELPLTPDESYVIQYPTRRQGRKIRAAQDSGDMDALLVALLGDEAGRRVAELSEDEPAYVLDLFLIDVMRKFGFIDEDETEDDDETQVTEGKSPDPAVSTPEHSPPRAKSDAA
ncbi:hypothetical protein [Amycolatopsis dendrobii]|uniref:Tail assembly chaperone n=1 Tax=Amycolatopsis dendrobii TaxID=2760662 RepID=A0A7W3ZA46_9PSEU|nr:hypothetical protein [Amycolatopsis dendrobii]MBB1153522.1 hypothetical protein [Amycolatopsis dendrobii]